MSPSHVSSSLAPILLSYAYYTGVAKLLTDTPTYGRHAINIPQVRRINIVSKRRENKISQAKIDGARSGEGGGGGNCPLFPAPHVFHIAVHYTSWTLEKAMTFDALSKGYKKVRCMLVL